MAKPEDSQCPAISLGRDGVRHRCRLLENHTGRFHRSLTRLWPVVHDERCCMAGADPSWVPHRNCLVLASNSYSVLPLSALEAK